MPKPPSKGNGSTDGNGTGNGHHHFAEDSSLELNTVLGGMLTDRGHESEKSGELSSALRDFELAVQATPDDALCWYNYGDTLLSLGRNKEALAALKRAVDMSPSTELYRYDLGLVLYSLGKYKEASKHFQLVVTSDPKLERARSHLGLSAITNLALCHGEQGNWEKALETLKPAESLVVNVLFNLGRFHIRNDSHAEAARRFKAAAVLAPDREDILHGAGCALMNLKRYDEAETYLAQSTKVDPLCVDGWHDRGVNLAGMNKKKQSRSCFLQVLKRDPRHAQGHYGLARLDALERRRDSAFRNLQHAVDRGLGDVARIRRDRDLASLRSDPRWKGLISRMRDVG